jgi:hypothetical protein
MKESQAFVCLCKHLTGKGKYDIPFKGNRNQNWICFLREKNKSFSEHIYISLLSCKATLLFYCWSRKSFEVSFYGWGFFYILCLFYRLRVEIVRGFISAEFSPITQLESVYVYLWLWNERASHPLSAWDRR